ncbi:hypothetical protein OQA88_13235 [Cercophora sp. LCS_1]
MTHPNSFAFDDFVVWPSSEPPNSLNDYMTGTPTDRLSSQSPPSTDLDVADVAVASQSTARRDWGLPFVQLAEWHEDLTYDEHPPTCIHYSIEWKLTINNRMAAKDTEQDLVLVPHALWDTLLQPKLKKLLDKKLPSNKVYKAEETNVVVSVTDRSERNLVKRFDELDIEWAILEKQLQTWSRRFLAGKRFRV